MESEGENDSTANSEIRYIALELMKLAQQSGKSFGEVAAEYMENAERLSMMIAGVEETAQKRAKKGASSKEK